MRHKSLPYSNVGRAKPPVEVVRLASSCALVHRKWPTRHGKPDNRRETSHQKSRSSLTSSVTAASVASLRLQRAIDSNLLRCVAGHKSASTIVFSVPDFSVTT